MRTEKKIWLNFGFFWLFEKIIRNSKNTYFASCQRRPVASILVLYTEQASHVIH